MRVLVDTSVWIDHFKKGEDRLLGLLEHCRVLMHPFVLGELACGNFRNRREVFALLADLPVAVVASDEEVLAFIEEHSLMGRGIGYMDAHLLAATRLNPEVRLWTRDQSLDKQATKMDIAV